MKEKIAGILVCIFLLTTSVSSSPITTSKINSAYNNMETKGTSENLINGAWYEIENNITILHLNGSFHEMGYQIGYFLKDKILQNLRALSEYSSINDTFRIWNIQKNYIPNEIADYIQGTADAIGLSYDDVGSTWIWEQTCSNPGCSSYIADGPATKNNEIIHVYSNDYPFRPKDPITGQCILGDPVLIVAKPDNGNAFMYPTFAGYVVESGVNEKGISICNLYSYTNDTNDYGTPGLVRVFEVLIHASTIEEAVNILDTNRTYGYNFLVSDGNTNQGYVIEQTANITYVGRWNDTCESEHPFYALDHVVRRVNHFINPETAATQRDYYNLKDLRYLLQLNLGNIFEWYRYKAISSACQKYIGNLDLNNSLSLLRDVYLGKYGGVIWYIIKNTYLKNANSWYQWSYSPNTGDMLICYASQDEVPSKNPIHHFNFFELLESEPP
jgi:hypothetical protein